MLVVGRRREQPLVSVGRLAEPARRRVQGGHLEQGVGHDAGDRIIAAQLRQQVGIAFLLAALEQGRRTAIERAVGFAPVLADDLPQPVGDHQVGADRPAALVRGHGQGPEAGIEEDLLQVRDGLARPGRIQADVRQQHPGLQPFGVGPRVARGRFELMDRRLPFPLEPQSGRLPHEHPEQVVAGGARQRDPVDRLIGTGPGDRLPVRLQRRVLAADRLRGPCQPVMIRGPLRRRAISSR